MKPTKHNLFLVKFISLFSVVRGYNILVLIIAQYLSAIFILAPHNTVGQIVFDFTLFLIILSTSLVIAAGYIINNFYDSQKDIINRPIKATIDRLVSQKTKLYFYFILNGIASVIGLFLSFKAFLFFSVYIFLIWFYSHKIKKIVFAGNVLAAVLAIFPFFGIFLYYKNLYEIIFFHASFLFLLILMRELVKDLENLKGDLANNYQTIPVVYSENTSKLIIGVCVTMAALPIYFLVEIFEVGYMNWFFYAALGALVVFLFLLKRASTAKHYLWLHNGLKMIIVSGVFSILLIEPDVILKSKILVLFL